MLLLDDEEDDDTEMCVKEFQNTFDKDLTYRDGSSFLVNIQTILTHNSPNKSVTFALVNNSRSIRKELKRINYWSKK